MYVALFFGVLSRLLSCPICVDSRVCVEVKSDCRSFSGILNTVVSGFSLALFFFFLVMRIDYKGLKTRGFLFPFLLITWWKFIGLMN